VTATCEDAHVPLLPRLSNDDILVAGQVSLHIAISAPSVWLESVSTAPTRARQRSTNSAEAAAREVDDPARTELQQPDGGETPGVAGAPVALAGSLIAGFADGGETPGVAVAPVALAGAIMAGFARPMLTLSLHAAEFGVGMTVIVGLMLVPASVAIAG